MKQIPVWCVRTGRGVAMGIHHNYFFTTKEEAEEFLQKNQLTVKLEVVQTVITIHESAMECLKYHGLLYSEYRS